MRTGCGRPRTERGGAASVAYQIWLQPDSPDHRLGIYTPNDAASADALQILTQHVAHDASSDVPDSARAR